MGVRVGQEANGKLSITHLLSHGNIVCTSSLGGAEFRHTYVAWVQVV